MPIIGLDAGHGGNSSGTYSVNTAKDGLFEKDYTLELVLAINEHLRYNGFKTVLTRTADTNPGTVVQRAKMLNNCDYAFSLHFNGFGNESANGTEVFVPYGEKNANIEVGYLKCLAKYFKERKPFARANSFYDRNAIFDKKMDVVTKRFNAYDTQKDYFGFIRTCWESGVSADLLEICFLTNPQDFKAYTEHVNEIAEGLAKAIVEGFGRKFISGETKTEKPKPRIKTRFDVLN